MHPHEAEFRIQIMGDRGEDPTLGGIAIVWRDKEGRGVEGVQSFGPNLVSFTVTTGRK